MSKARVDGQAGFVLHTYPYRETSLIVEAFTRDHGRVAFVARGARRPKSVLRGVLLAFVPLEFGWFGQGELRTLARAEWLGGQPLLRGEALLCGYYLNELMLRLCARDDAHTVLFDFYRDTLRELSRGVPIEPLLRRFELNLLAELGYGVRLDVEADTDAPLEAGRRYAFIIERGVVAAEDGPFSGATLLNMACGQFDHPDTLAAAKTLMRHLIQHHLCGQPLQSRRVFRELQAL